MPKMDIIARQLYTQICMCALHLHAEAQLLILMSGGIHLSPLCACGISLAHNINVRSFLAFARHVTFELYSVSGPPTLVMKL